MWLRYLLFFFILRDLDMVGVTGSIPVPPTNLMKHLSLFGLDADNVVRQTYGNQRLGRPGLFRFFREAK